RQSLRILGVVGDDQVPRSFDRRTRRVTMALLRQGIRCSWEGWMRIGPCVGMLLAVAPLPAIAAGPDAGETSPGYPDNPVSDYVDRSSDGLTSTDPPGTSASSLTSMEVETPSPAPVKAPKPAEWMLVPIPGYNPTLGFSLTAMGAYIFPADAKSPPSTAPRFRM